MNIEIEKKYIIELPKKECLMKMSDYTESEIIQIYLSSEKGVTHRIRSRKMSGNVNFTETKKVRIDKMSALEDEHEISEDEFLRLSKMQDKGTRAIKKTRHTFIYKGQLFEIDVYPEWERHAILETELCDRDADVIFPEFIRIVRDVTGEKSYSNASMSRSFPKE